MHFGDVAGLQNEDGSFSGDEWGEVDTRFSYIAICCLALLHQLNKINVEKAVKYIVSCKNLDGGFGCTPGGESHAGQIKNNDSALSPPSLQFSVVWELLLLVDTMQDFHFLNIQD
ncbi:hypothetical protein G4B88_000973 [Cannabis sativa]|uniref:Geranylgeranyl transferase type II subunit beta n=1 Tax=Cannabis sativa TaxID=3483 RepID=A0A7J6FDE3_CANSA|nr:hypothetical protein G4B88_000973 [Cannabis sativa]